MGGLKVGDFVYGLDGRPTKVVAATEVLNDRECYSLLFRGCDPIVADAGHQWLLRDGSIATSEEIFKRLSAGETVHIPWCRGVHSEERSLPVDPYVLGVWLGDGHEASARVTVGVGDEETIVNLVRCECPVRVKKYKGSSAYTVILSPTDRDRKFCPWGHDLRVDGAKQKSGHTICRGCERERDHLHRNGTQRSSRKPLCMQESLKRLGVLGNKHIPEEYILASPEQRVALLNGLMDSDGSVSRAGQCEYATKSDVLAAGVSRILSSLGIVFSVRKKPGTIGGKVVGCYWRFVFSPPAGMRVFRLSRKQKRLEESPRRRGIFNTLVACEKVKSVPVRCIQVDSPDGVFLAGKQFVPTHNSTLLSGIGLYTMVADGEASAECFGCATSREQASIVYKQMKELVESSPYLSEMLEVIDSRKTIAYIPTHSFWKVISSDAGRQEGLNIHSLCYDEIHSAKDRKLWDAIRYGGISRSQSLILAITTAGVDRNSIGFELHEHAMKVRQDPTYDEQFFAYVAAAAPEDDYRDPEVWKAANPSWGVTMDEDSFRADVRDAEQSNSRLASFLRYRLNVWTQGDGNKYIKLDQWDRCKGDSGTLGADRIWYAGLDLAQTWDCNAFVAVSKANDGVFDVMCRFWIPGENAGVRSQKDGVPYTTWAQNPRYGLTLTPGNTCDYDFIRRDILQFCKERTVRMIAVDPHNSHYLVQQLQAEGLNVSGFSQGFTSMNPGVRLLDTLIAQGRLRTNDNPILNWMAGNATTKENSEGYVKVVKPSPTSPLRVDGIVSLIMAIAIASDAENAKPAPEPEILIL